MARSTATFSVMLIVWSWWHGLGLSCYSTELFKRVHGPPLYLQLLVCWHQQLSRFFLVSWTQVGPTGLGNTTGTVFVVKKNKTVPGKAPWFNHLNHIPSLYLIHVSLAPTYFLVHRNPLLFTVIYSIMTIYPILSFLSIFLLICRTHIYISHGTNCWWTLIGCSTRSCHWSCWTSLWQTRPCALYEWHRPKGESWKPAS